MLKQLDYKYRLEDIRNIITMSSYELDCMHVIDDKVKIYFSAGRIGPEWANLYTNYFLDSGFTHFKRTFCGTVSNPHNNPYIGTTEEIIFESKNKETAEKVLYKYKLEISEIKEKRDYFILKEDEINKSNILKTQDIYVITDSKLRINEIDDREIIYEPISYSFKTIISNSYNLQDNSIWLFKDLDLGEVTYPIIDFLYFSAVTITTLGYGDILPNSTLIRFFVMLESILGVIIIGVYISRVLEANRRKN